MRAGVSLVIALASLLGAGCSNPFLAHYKGVRCPPVETVHVATQAPVEARLLGSADFITTSAVGDVEAIRAAEDVGANIVQWDRAFLRQDVVLQGEPMPDGTVNARGELLVEGSEPWYRIHARFWRSEALGGFAESGPAPAGTDESKTKETGS